MCASFFTIMLRQIAGLAVTGSDTDESYPAIAGLGAGSGQHDDGLRPTFRGGVHFRCLRFEHLQVALPASGRHRAPFLQQQHAP